jgi:hypothetical protein
MNDISPAYDADLLYKRQLLYRRILSTGNINAF